MATMSLDNEIRKYLPELDNGQKQSILSVIKSFIKLKELSQPAQKISIEDYNKEAHQAMERVAGGQSYTQEEVEEMAKEW